MNVFKVFNAKGRLVLSPTKYLVSRYAPHQLLKAHLKKVRKLSILAIPWSNSISAGGLIAQAHLDITANNIFEVAFQSLFHKVKKQ